MDACVGCVWFKWTERTEDNYPIQGMCLPHGGGCKREVTYAELHELPETQSEE